MFLSGITRTPLSPRAFLFSERGLTSVAGYQDVVLADTPVAYYRLGAGATPVDLTGHGFDGEYVGTATVAGAISGDSDLARSLDAVDDQVKVPNTLVQAVDNGSPLSVEFWLHWPSGENQNGGAGFRLEVPPESECLVHAYMGYGNTTLYWDVGTNAATKRITYDYAAYRGNWAHLVFVDDQAAEHSIYINGNKVADAASVNATGVATASGFGSFGMCYSGFFKGYFDEIAVYNKALSPTRILAHYTAGSGA